MDILIVAATPFEIAPLHAYLTKEGLKKTNAIVYTKGELHVHLLITGVGLTATAYAMGRYLGSVSIDLAINLGIAGALDRTLQLGQVLHIVEDSFGDLGIELADGSFQDLFQAQLSDANQSPYTDGKLQNKGGMDSDFLPTAKGVSVHTVHGTTASIQRFQQQNPNAQVESMEGAAFFFVCFQEKITCLQIRAISNYVEQRNKSNWEIELAIDNLNKIAIEMIDNLLTQVSVKREVPERRYFR